MDRTMRALFLKFVKDAMTPSRRVQGPKTASSQQQKLQICTRGGSCTPLTSSRFQSRFCVTSQSHTDKIQQQGDMLVRHVPCNSGKKHWSDMITRHTAVSRDHLTPEILLRLITPQCPLWHQSPDQCPFDDPFWAFYWPGGQALTRYILDNPHVVRGRSVLDVGAGCGASAIAAVMGGARRVLANDIDPVAGEAIKLNAGLNNITLEMSTDNLIGQKHPDCTQWDVVFLGDMFYDWDFTREVADWLKHLRSKSNSCILIGDPGRVYLKDHPMRDSLKLLFEIDLPSNCIEENRGHSSGYVWEFVFHKHK